MRMAEALKIAAIGLRPKGYRVSYDKKDGCMLLSGYFPERDEPLIPSEDEAWELAGAFARRTYGEYVNIYVIDDRWKPVLGYAEKKIANR